MNCHIKMQKIKRRYKIVKDVMNLLKNLGKFFVAITVAVLLSRASSSFGSLATVNSGAGDVALSGASDGNTDATGGGSPLASIINQPYSYDGGVGQGTLSSYVYATGVDPLNTLGGLTFVYVLSVTAEPNELLGELQIGSIPSGSCWGSTVVMGYGTGTAAAPATGSLNTSLNPYVLNFKWSSETTTSGTFYLVVATSLQSYEYSTATVQDGGASPNITVLVPAGVPVMTGGPVVTNVVATQRSGTGLVDIYYSVSSPSNSLKISVSNSINGVIPFKAMQSLTGDVGSGITPGTGKHIIWNAGADLSVSNFTDVVVLVAADDLSYITTAPEPSTLYAGALLLLPFAYSFGRILSKIIVRFLSGKKSAIRSEIVTMP